MTDTLQLQEALATGGIRAVNFFNGRLLTGRDLSRVDRRGGKATGGWATRSAMGLLTASTFPPPDWSTGFR